MTPDILSDAIAASADPLLRYACHLLGCEHAEIQIPRGTLAFRVRAVSVRRYEAPAMQPEHVQEEML